MKLSRKEWLMLAVLVFGAFVTVLNQTLVTPASFGSSDLKAEPKRQRTEGPRPGGRKATAL